MEDFEIVVTKDNEEIKLSKSMAEKYLSKHEYKILLSILKKRTKGKELKEKDVVEINFLIHKINTHLFMDEHYDELNEEQRELVNDIRKLEKEVEDKAIMHHRAIKLFTIYSISFFLILFSSIIAFIISLWIPTFETAANIISISSNALAIVFLIHSKETVYDWENLNLKAKVIWWFCLLLNMCLCANGLVNMFDIKLSF